MNATHTLSPNEPEVIEFFNAAMQVVGFEGNDSALFGQQAWDSLLPPAFQFSDNRQEATRVAQQVLTGEKTTFETPEADFVESGSALPAVGDMSIICDGNGNPVALVQDTSVEKRPGADGKTLVVEHYDCIYPQPGQDI